MMDVVNNDARISDVLIASAERHGVPGAQLALMHGDRLFTAACGVARVGSPDRVTADTRFQIGSSTKMLTAMLVGVAVDQNKFGLHDPIDALLPGVRDGHGVSAFHLLTHTGGFDGDVAFAADESDDAIGAYVRQLADLPQADPPGRRHAYCNAGFAVLARLCELAFDMIWDEAVTRFVTQPCGMDGFLPGAHRLPVNAAHAFGHNPPSAQPVESLPLFSERSQAPAGGGPLGRAGDMMALAGVMHQGGRARDGAQVISPEWAQAMKTRHVKGPSASFASAWGLGVMFHDWSHGVTVYGHEGVTPGQLVHFRIHDDTRSAVCVFTNGGFGDALADDVFRTLYAPIVGGAPLDAPAPIALSSNALDLFQGRYESYSGVVTVTAAPGALHAAFLAKPEGLGAGAGFDVPLTPIEHDGFLAQFPHRKLPLVQRFQDFDAAGRPQVLNFRGRVFHRVHDGGGGA